MEKKNRPSHRLVASWVDKAGKRQYLDIAAVWTNEKGSMSVRKNKEISDEKFIKAFSSENVRVYLNENKPREDVFSAGSKASADDDDIF